MALRAPPQGHLGVSSSKSVWHVRETKGFGSLASESRTRAAEESGKSRAAAGTAAAATRCPRASMSPRARATLERFRAQQYNDSPMPGRGSSLDGSRPGASLSGRFNSLNPVRAAVDMSKKDTRGGKILGGLLKFCGVLDMEGNERGSKANYNKYRERFQDQNRLSWIEHPESHTQYARGNVMFRTEVSRVMACFYGPDGAGGLPDRRQSRRERRAPPEDLERPTAGAAARRPWETPSNGTRNQRRWSSACTAT